MLDKGTVVSTVEKYVEAVKKEFLALHLTNKHAIFSPIRVPCK